jgi:hypothetical protein
VGDGESVAGVADALGEPEGEKVPAVADGEPEAVLLDTVFVAAADGVLEPVADAVFADALGEPEGELVPVAVAVTAVAEGVGDDDADDVAG